MPSGSCICGDIAYEYTGAPALTALCHCKDCQKWSGGGHTSNIAVPTTAFTVTKGTPRKYTRLGNSGEPHDLFFCGRCGSSLYAQPHSMEGVTLVKGGGMDGGAGEVEIGTEFYTKDRRGFETLVVGAKQFKTME